MRHPVRLALALAAVVAATGGTLVAGRFLALPEAALGAEAADPGASFQVQQGLVELFLRQARASHRTDPVVFTAAELNAFLARNLESRRLALRPLLVRAEADWLEVAGRTSVRSVLTGSVVEGLVEVLPAALLDADVWVSARGRLAVRDGKGEFLVEQARLGRQRVPAAWLWGILGVHPREILTWRMLRVVERIEVQPGRLLIHTRHAGG